jgi:hypothetical protein
LTAMTTRCTLNGHRDPFYVSYVVLFATSILNASACAGSLENRRRVQIHVLPVVAALYMSATDESRISHAAEAIDPPRGILWDDQEAQDISVCSSTKLLVGNRSSPQRQPRIPKRMHSLVILTKLIWNGQLSSFNDFSLYNR